MSPEKYLSDLVALTSTYILIIDDSDQICSLLVTGIIAGCAQNGQTCRVVQSGPFGMIEMIPLNFASDVFDDKIVNVYTANSPRNALNVLRLPQLERLTIICDIMLPNDTQVGLVGLLDELNRLALPVNLVFASSEGQNRFYVEQLLSNHKAFFLEKGTTFWDRLPYALVENSGSFQYHRLTPPDYARQPILMPVLAATTAVGLERPSVASRHSSELSDFSLRELKTSTGLLKLLTFWRNK